ncbi:unnamed protein product [Chironomus riparius]|uniref:Uncharacterized protein n=1 Tax=Chironomus riparius TaxID=315576 RepID=A0A9N9WU93_9DIPT|nr:unnamed protein product [Chironomus riparius]
MKLRILIILVSFKCMLAQDVKVPEDLLKPKTTTLGYEHETIQFTDIEINTEITTTTTNDFVEDTTIGSLDHNPNNPKSDKLTDNKLPLYVYPQYPNLYPNYLQNLQYETPNCNQNPPSYPVVIPPIYDSKTVEPDIEENIECPIDFIKSESTCIPLHSNNCPFNYIWKNDRCVLSQTVCPLNFEYDGTSCVERQVCPPNHAWKNGKCVLPEPTCPIGWQWNGNTCEIINIQCQPGFILKGKECVLEKITCPNGFNLVNEQCVTPPPVCMPGYELQETGFCLQINKKCPPGTVMINEKCQETTVSCLPGYEKIGNQCYKILEIPTIPPPSLEIATTTKRAIITHPIDTPSELTTESIIPDIPPPPLTKICPDDFIFHNSQCYRCPSGYSLCNGMCLRNVAPCRPNYSTIPMPMPPNFYPNIQIPNINIHLNIPSHDIPKLSPRRSDKEPINVINHIEPINNTIYNINNITHPVTLNNVNENNIFVYTDTQCADGKIRTTIIKNNQTIMGCNDSDSSLKLENSPEKTTTEESDVREEEITKSQKCCEVVTPRRCKKRFTNQWMCTHRRYKHCGEICIANRLYIKPPATVWSNQILTIAPSPIQTYIKPCFGHDCPSVDCTGCIDGSFNCSPQCYTYPCYGDGCTYIDQNQFCENYSDKEFCD